MRSRNKRAVLGLIAFLIAAGFLLRAEERDALRGVQEEGAPLDVSSWAFRKPVEISQPGVQQLELDLDILSHAQSGLEDVRVMRGGNQVPYIIEHTSVQRSLVPGVSTGNDPQDQKTSRWILKLPNSNIPVTRLECEVPTPLFQRQLVLYEQLHDERGETYQHSLGSASWTQTHGVFHKAFELKLNSEPQSDTLFLETENGDNPPIQLENIQLFYPATRILFKAKPGDSLFVYYGNRHAASPHYDLSLVANELLAANRSSASLGAEDQLKKFSWRENQKSGRGSVLFWGILALVVVGLLVIISRLLPKSEPQPPPK